MTTAGKILFLGHGYTASFVSKKLQAAGWAVHATARTPQNAEVLRTEGVIPLPWPHHIFSPDSLTETSALLITTPPDNDGCPALNAANTAIAASAGKFQWIGYLSSNGVYGDHDGAWVDEETAPKPTTERGKRRLSAEKQWLNLASDHNLPLVIFRLPGIYGPGRSAFDSLRSETAKRIIKPGQVFNRMHVEDIATALTLSLQRNQANGLYNLSDDEPSPPQDVIEYAAKLMGVEPPNSVSIDETELSPMSRSFYAENKRVSNKRMKETLGVKLMYPTYREGLDAIFQEET